MIKGQSSLGFWDVQSKEVLAKRIDGDSVEDATVRQALVEAGLAGEVFERAYMTLLALFILQEVFVDNADEWKMIARKAKTYLEQAGVQKPGNLLFKFSLLPLFD